MVIEPKVSMLRDTEYPVRKLLAFEIGQDVYRVRDISTKN